MVTLRFVAGTIEIVGLPRDTPLLPEVCRWDRRSGCHRVQALYYADVVLALREAQLSYADEARKYAELAVGECEHLEPRPFQAEAVDAWCANAGRGVVVLPTGAGKSQVGVMAIDAQRRSTLVIAPTLDLVRQWYDLLRRRFDIPVGVVGGGEYDPQPITITTYDSAYLHMENLGSRFGLVIFDECHHLPGDAFSLAARCCLAPFRLGLTATPERADGRHSELELLIGPVALRRDIVELSGEYLSPYETIHVDVELSSGERERYDAARAIYIAFLRKHGITMSGSRGWSEFLMRASRGEEGRNALRAYREQRQLAFMARAKLDYVARLLKRHRRDRILIFTQDNAAAYRISRDFLIPCITHQTKVTERSAILSGLADGTYFAAVTSKVLNEGVDVPQANVAIVVSGSGSVREHVQRLGRVLRKQRDKHACLYELVTRGTGEAWTSKRRRDHSAYR